jgi:hypothetical protein
MGLLDRLFKKPPTPGPIDFSVPGRVDAELYEGDETLNVVGESYRQDTLWRIVGGRRAEPVRKPIVALLVPEPENEHDPNAIKVLIGGQPVGYLSRDDAAAYLPGLQTLIANNINGLVALKGTIVGGGQQLEGLGSLGVFLDHNPADFGIKETGARHITLANPPAGFGFMTGLSEARTTDLEDDSYDLSWLDGLSPNVATAIKQLRTLLATVDDPIDRHYMLAELEHRLYGFRDAFASALDEYDDVCREHDEAMDEIRAALLAKFGKIPILDTYRQAGVRCQRARDWEAVRRWCERGLSVYGDNAAKPEFVDDLRKRLAHAMAKINAASPPERPRRPGV